MAVRDPASLTEIPFLFQDAGRYLDRASARFHEIVEIAFQAVDSGHWLVWARNAAVRERIGTAFASVETIPKTSLTRPEG